jgi:hypothetical protein
MALWVDQGTGQRYCRSGIDKPVDESRGTTGVFISRPGDSGPARFGAGWEASMAKIRISSTDLVWVFHQRLEAFDDCPPEVPIAIVPAHDVGWRALMREKDRTQHPHWARRVEGIQKQLREIYVLGE